MDINMSQDYFQFLVPQKFQITVAKDGSWSQKKNIEWNYKADTKIANLWNICNSFAEDQFDTNSRISLLWILLDPNTTTEQKQKIQAVQQWWAEIWNFYKAEKQKLQNGLGSDMDVANSVGSCPYTIWQIVG